MYDVQKNIEYNFTGDVSGLEQATKDAISLLDMYEDKINSLVNAGNFNVSPTVFKSFNRTVSNITKQVNALVNSLNTSSKELQTSLVPDTSKIEGVSRDIEGVLETLVEASRVSSTDIKFLNDYLKQTQANIADVANKAQILSSNFQKLSQLNLPKFSKTPAKDIEHLTNTTSKAATVTQSSVNKMQSAYSDLAKNAKFVQYAKEVEEASKRISKSARESAKVITSSSDVEFEDKLNRIREASNSFANGIRSILNKTKDLFTPMTSKVQEFKDKSSSSFSRIKQMATAAGSGFTQFKGDFDKAGAALSKVFSTVSPKVAVAIKVFQGLRKVLGTLSKFVKPVISAFQSAEKVVRSFVSKIGDGLKSLLPKVDNIKSAFSGLATFISGVASGKVFGEAVKQSIAYIENLNLFTVAMGESVGEASKFIDTMSEIYGMDPSNLYRYSGYFYQLTDAIGMTDKASKTMSLSLTKASNDIASLFNVEIEQVVENLASGMQGMSRAVRKYGIDIRATTLAQTALNYGFTENVSTTSEANRQALRYLTIMDQVKNATKQVTTGVDGSSKVMGDFARNIETPANQLRIMKEQAVQVARAFGNFFIPIMQKVLYVINGVLMAIKVLLEFLAALVGVDIDSFGGDISAGADDAAGAVGGIGDSADSAAKKLRKLVAPFDELTILSQNQDSGSGDLGGVGSEVLDPGLAEALENMSLGLDEVRMKALDVRDKILDLLGLEFDGENITVTADGFIDKLMDMWDKEYYARFGELIADFFNQGIEWGLEHTDPSKYAPILNEKVQTLAEILNGFVSGFDWNGLGTIIGNGITLALGAIDTFITSFSWRSLGSSLADGLNGMITSVDWNLLGKTIGDYFMAKIMLISGFFENFDWATLGTSLANGLMSMLRSINWNEIGQAIVYGVNGVLQALSSFLNTYDYFNLGAELGNGLNTIVTSVNWESLGSSIGELFMEAVRTLSNFFQKFDWKELGGNLAKGFTALLNSISWDGLGRLVSSKFNGLIDGLKQFWATYEWGALGSDLARWISVSVREINWHNVGSTISDTIRGLLREVTNFISEIDWFSVGKGISEAIMAIDWLGLLTDVFEFVVGVLGGVVRGGIGLITGIFTGIGEDVTGGFQDGIVEGFKNIGRWLKEHLVDPVVRAVKHFFGIHSPSTVFKEIGNFLVEGLFSGITEKIRSVSNWIKTNFIDPVVNAVKNLFGIHSPSTVFKSIGLDLIQGMLNGITEKLSNIVNWIQTHIVDPVVNAVKNLFGARSSPSTVFKSVGLDLIQGLYNGITDKLRNIALWVRTHIVDPVVNPIKNLFGISGNTSSAFKGIGESIIGGFMDGLDTIGSQLGTWGNDLKLSLDSIFEDVSTKVSGAINGVKTSIDSAASWVSNKWNDVSTTVKNTVSNIPNQFNSAKNKKTSSNTVTRRSNIVRKFATGGVVRGPTHALIGEGHYNEAVIPLGNSPELQDMIDKIATAVSSVPHNNTPERPIEVRVYLDGTEITTRQNRINRMYGRTQQNI